MSTNFKKQSYSPIVQALDVNENQNKNIKQKEDDKLENGEMEVKTGKKRIRKHQRNKNKSSSPDHPIEANDNKKSDNEQDALLQEPSESQQLNNDISENNNDVKTPTKRRQKTNKFELLQDF